VKRAGPPLESVASTVQKLAVLLGAGVPPVAAWRYLGEPGREVTAAIEGGLSIPSAIRSRAGPGASPAGRAWAGVAAAWQVASDAGAPIASTLREFARSLRAIAAIERDIETALAGPRATARLVMVLPGLGIVFGVILGLNPLAVLVGTPAGAACLVAGVGLMAGAWWWNRRLVAAARPRDLTPGLRCDLMAIAVAGGTSLDRASAAVDRALGENGFDPSLGRDDVDKVIALSRAAGVPAAELLRSQADQSRLGAAAEAERRASVLAVRLMLPLGVCVLPAFMLLGVVPLLISVISSTVVGF